MLWRRRGRRRVVIRIHTIRGGEGTKLIEIQLREQLGLRDLPYLEATLGPEQTSQRGWNGVQWGGSRAGFQTS